MSQHPSPPPQAPPPQALPPQAWARTFLIVLVFFAGSLFMAGITAGLIVSGMNTAGGAVAAELDPVLTGSSTWVVLTFQLLAMGFFSPLSIGVDLADFGMFAAGGSLFFVPWWVPIGGIAAVAATQRFLGGNLRVPQIGSRLMLSGIAGLAFATIMTILAAVIRFPLVDDIELFGISMWADAASFPGFLVAAVLVGCIAYVLLLPRRSDVVQRVLTSFAAVFEHVIVVSGIALLGTVIVLLVQGDTDGLLLILAVAPTVGFLMFSLLHFIPAVAAGHEQLTGSAGDEWINLYVGHPAVWITGMLAILVAIGITAFRWNLRTRFHAHALWSWIMLPVTYLLVGLLLTLGNGLYFSMFAEGDGLYLSVSSAVWGFLVWLALGAVVQLLAVYLMPGLARRFPAGLVRVLGWGLASHQPTTRQPTSRKVKGLLWAGLGILVLAAVAWIAHTVVARTVFGPEDTAEAYLQAVVDGRAEDALEIIEPSVADDLHALANDEVYQAATDRPDRFELGEVTYHASAVHDVIVDATIYQSGKAYPLKLGFVESGTQAGIFSDWDLRGGDVSGSAEYLSGPSQLTVNGVEVDIEPYVDPYAPTGTTADPTHAQIEPVLDVERIGQVLLPGTYTFTAPEGSKYLSHGDDLELTITPGEHSQTPIEFNQSYTEAFETEAVAQIEQRLESCLADATIRVDDCEAASWEDTGWNAMTDMQRTWEHPPEIELVPAEEDTFGVETDLTQYSGPVTARVVDGSINVSYQVRDDEDDDWMDRDRVYSPFETHDLEPMEFPITLDGDEIQVDYSALDQYNPSWLSQEFQD